MPENELMLLAIAVYVSHINEARKQMKECMQTTVEELEKNLLNRFRTLIKRINQH